MSSKLLLLILADYHDDERDIAWPSQKRLAEDCEMPIRTVQYALQSLEQDGFISTLQKGNQYQPTHYRLNLSTVHAQIREPAMVAPAQAIAPAQSYEPAMSEPAMVAPAKVNPQPNESAKTKSDTILFTSLHSPPLPTTPLEPPID
ncbi:MAG: helix-turn-helix domain-containing protein, partial [Chloroflexota bacterium]